MKAITVHQPWATLVALGEKKFETRSWRTNYRGELAIHSAKVFCFLDQELCRHDPFQEILHEYIESSPDRNKRLWLGCILAICELVDCIPVEKIKPHLTLPELAFGDYYDGRFAWQLKLLRLPQKPIPARGFQGLWDWQEPNISFIEIEYLPSSLKEKTNVWI